ncbi:MAG: family 78 glycoside hydrolase catalytic domain [Microbacterium enclense]
MIAVGDLTVEHALDPVGVSSAPRFGWTLRSDVDGVRQLSFRVSVRDAVGTIWQSGPVESDRSVDVAYDGPPLASLRRYAWSVVVTTTAGDAAATGSFVTGVLDDEWRGAASIGGAEDDAAAPLLRTEFDVDAAPDEAYLVVGAGGLARVELDGTPADDSVLGPGFTDYEVSAQYTVIDVTDRLTPGRHAIGVELGRGFYGMRGRNTWNWETAPWHADPSTRVLLLLRDSRGERVVVSDSAWRSTDGPTRFDDLYAGEDYDARLEQPGWSTAGFDDTGWGVAREVDGPRGLPVVQRQPPIVEGELLEPTQVSPLGEDRWVVSFPRVIAGWVEIEAEADPGAEIELRFGESLRADGTPNSDDEKGYFDGRFQTDRVTLSDRPLRWHPRFTWHGFQHVEVRARELPTLRARVVHTRAARTGRFETSSPMLNTLHELTVRTILNNLHGIPTDTPKYEKNGWTGDGMVGARMMLLNLDTHELLAKWVADVAASRHGEGAPEVIAPHGGWRMDWTPAPTWHSALLLVPWDIYRLRGDARVLADVWPDARDYLRFELSRGVDGLFDTTLGDWVSPETDPGGGNAPEDTRVAATAFVVAMCDTAAAMARVLGEDPGEWELSATRSRTAFLAEFWDAETAELRGRGDDGYRQAHTALALAFDILPEADRRRAADRLAADVVERGHHLSTGALATKHLLPQLTRFGHADVAVGVALQTTFPSWGFWVENGATSLWEHWKEESRSRGHYFLGTIEDWFYADVAGLEAVAPGWREARIAPQVLGTALSSASAAVRTPYGELSVQWRVEDGEVALSCEVPIGVRAEIELPGLRRRIEAGRHEVRVALG